MSVTPYYHPILPLLCDSDVYLQTHPESLALWADALTFAFSARMVSRLDLNVLLNWDTVLASKMWRSRWARPG
jgi:hypothetical protein